VEQSGEGERRLHSALMEEPRRPLEEKDLAAIEDADARDNYRVLARFREKLLGAGTVEGCYMSLFKAPIDVPPMFVDQLAHVILRNILDGCDDALRLRAAELFFRSQKATIQDGHVLLADLETVEMHASGNRYGSIGRLIVEAQGDVFQKDLDVLDRANAAIYWERESRHDTVISLTYGRAALDALARVIEAWVAHFHAVEVKVEPLRRIEEARWAWHIGLDAESTEILNALWTGEQVDAGRMRNLIALFELRFADPAVTRDSVAGRSVYLALSVDEEQVVRMKPQNLLTNLPLREA
jgi:plasmid stability protein